MIMRAQIPAGSHFMGREGSGSSKDLEFLCNLNIFVIRRIFKPWFENPCFFFLIGIRNVQVR
jgi:hypothetical protein